MPTHPGLSPTEYLNDVHKNSPEFEDGEWEGDFDYLDGDLVRHDYGDWEHSRMHTLLTVLLMADDLGFKPLSLPSFTLQINPTRFRVPDLVLYDRAALTENPVMTDVPYLIVEVLSPEDTFMFIAKLVADYLAMGVENIWVVDPSKLEGWICRAGEWKRSTGFTFPSGRRLELAEASDD